MHIHYMDYVHAVYVHAYTASMHTLYIHYTYATCVHAYPASMHTHYIYSIYVHAYTASICFCSSVPPNFGMWCMSCQCCKTFWMNSRRADSPNSDWSSARCAWSPLALAFAMRYHLTVPADTINHVAEQHLQQDAHDKPWIDMHTAYFAGLKQRFAWCSASGARWSRHMQACTPNFRQTHEQNNSLTLITQSMHQENPMKMKNVIKVQSSCSVDSFITRTHTRSINACAIRMAWGW